MSERLRLSPSYGSNSLMHLGSSGRGPCLTVIMRSGQGCTSPRARRHRRRQSSAHTCAGFHVPNGVLYSPIMTCRSPSRSSDLFSSSGWAHMLCQMSRAGLTGQLCHGICADAPSAPHGLLGMSGIASLIALILVIFGRTMRSCLMRHLVPMVPSYGTKIRSLFVLSFWPL